MLQNKIYHNFLIEIIKNFSLILFGLSIIALTVRAVSFLDLIVDNGYPTSIYFKYTFFNFFGIAPKFIPLSFLLALMIFILKHLQDSEFLILWTAGVKKIYLVNLFFIISIIVVAVHLIFSVILTPTLLNKSRQLLGNENLNSFLPTVKIQQFSDSFEGFTFIVENKINNELKNIFMHDKGKNLKNLSSNASDITETAIIAKSGIIEKNKLFLFSGQIISSKENSKDDIFSFDQFNIDLGNLNSNTIKEPKIQETSTLQLIRCFFSKVNEIKLCDKNYKKELLPTLNRRIIIPLYIPILSLICSLLLLKTKNKNLSKVLIFFLGFLVLLFTELAVRYTGINKSINFIFLIFPFILFFSFYSYLTINFTKELKVK